VKYWIETYGCQMNKAESAALELELRELGFGPAAADADADLVLLNTCSVRQTAENRIWGRLGHYRRLKHRRPFLLGIMGCMGERAADEVKERVPEVDLVMGVFDRERLVAALRAGRVGQGGTVPDLHVAEDEYTFARVHGDTGFRALVPIMHGCDNFCSYCIVPFVRGREVSRPPEAIRAELAGHAARGVKEVTLLGQNVNSYGSAGGAVDFAGLLGLVEEWVRGTSIRRVRFLTSHPKDLSDAVIAALARSAVLCRHVHLPVQNGSDEVLERMGRRYTRAGYLDLVRRLRNAVPQLSLSTDILVGFPGETEADHRLTLELMREVGFDDAYTYHYNVRAGTRAALWGDTVADLDKRRRLIEVIELQRSISARRRGALLGRRATVLVEEVSRNDPGELLARTEWNHMAVFAGSPELVGSFVTLSLEDLRGSTLWGRAVGDSG
jgi:tRNA-2-methylthio-N6-dimethylallyladenosine synthase